MGAGQELLRLGAVELQEERQQKTEASHLILLNRSEPQLLHQGQMILCDEKLYWGFLVDLTIAASSNCLVVVLSRSLNPLAFDRFQKSVEC